MPSLAAATLFLCAAFAWVPPLIDRAGLAALGFAFMAVSVGRLRGRSRPSSSSEYGAEELELPPEFEGIVTSIQERLGAYGAARGSGS